VVQIEEETCTRQLWYGKACMYIHTAVRYLVWVNVFLNDNRHETLYSEGSFLNGFSSLHRKKISRLANVVAWPFFRLGSKFLPSPTLKKTDLCSCNQYHKTVPCVPLHITQRPGPERIFSKFDKLHQLDWPLWLCLVRLIKISLGNSTIFHQNIWVTYQRARHILWAR
jgi:hypothetical protein